MPYDRSTTSTLLPHRCSWASILLASPGLDELIQAMGQVRMGLLRLVNEDFALYFAVTCYILNKTDKLGNKVCNCRYILNTVQTDTQLTVRLSIKERRCYDGYLLCSYMGSWRITT